MRKIRAATLNIWSGLNYHGLIKMGEYEIPEVRAARFELLVSQAKELNPDILVLNEANPHPFYARKIAQALGMDVVGHMGVSGLRAGAIGLPVNLREADLILASKELNLKYKKRIRLGGPGIVRKSFSFHHTNHTQAVLATIELNGRELFICATHWFAAPDCFGSSDERLEQLCKQWQFPRSDLKKSRQRLQKDQKWKEGEARRLIRFLQNEVPAGAPLLVLGDFNAAPQWREIEMLKSSGLIDCFEAAGDGEGITWHPDGNSNLINYYIEETQVRQKNLYHQLHALDEMDNRRIDYIFAGGSLNRENITQSGVVFDRAVDGLHISDHYGVTADLVL